MSELNIIEKVEKAVRSRLRFNTVRGLVSVEDLWILPLEVKDPEKNPSVYKLAEDLNTLIKSKSDALSFISKKKKSKEDIDNELKFEIVKYIIETRHAEADAKEKEMARKSRKADLRVLIDKKKLEKEAEKSINELEALYNSMED